MKARDMVKNLMESNGITNATLANRLGMTISATWELTAKPNKTKDMSTAKLVPVLTALDYKLVAIPRDEKVPKDGYVID